jgi:putative heme-binding domain-containing protein
MFPHRDANVNRELAILLTQFRRDKVLDEPVHEKLLDAMMKAKDDRPQQIHFFYCLRLLHDGWTKEQKATLLSWFESTRDWKGGASFQGFLDNIFKDLTSAFTKEDRVEVVSKAKDHPRSAFALLKSATVDQLPTPEKLHELLTKLGSVPSLPRGGDLKNAIVEAIGRHGTPEARKVLVRVIEEEPSLRAVAALGLSRYVTSDVWPYLVKALDTTNKQALFEIIQALRKSSIKPKPEDAVPYRAAILASSKLDPNNRRHVVDLLRHWAGNKRFSADENDWKGELAAWSRWFGQTFPKEPALPDVVSDKPPESKWKYGELLAYLDGEGKQGDATKGRAAFEKGQCLKCHKYGKEGEGLGPDLTTLSKRFKRSDTLDSLFHPSKVISDQYRSTTLVTKKGLSISGLAATQGDTVTVLQADGTKLTLKKGEIEQQLASLTSVMPERLLDLLTKEEIRDLFAFMESEPAK